MNQPQTLNNKYDLCDLCEDQIDFYTLKSLFFYNLEALLFQKLNNPTIISNYAILYVELNVFVYQFYVLLSLCNIHRNIIEYYFSNIII